MLLFGVLLAACAGGVSAPDAGTGVLLIQVDLVSLTSAGKPDVSAFLYAFKLKSLETGRTITVSDTESGRPAILSLPAGVYCVSSFNTYVNVELPYCADPFFKVVGGQVNNAGKWTFGISYGKGTHALLSSLQDMSGVEARAKLLQPQLFSVGARN
jgi:hypothetical protein